MAIWKVKMKFEPVSELILVVKGKKIYAFMETMHGDLFLISNLCYVKNNIIYLTLLYYITNKYL